MAQQMLGFVGLGNLGLPMVANLVERSWCVQVHDLDPDRVRQATDAGQSVVVVEHDQRVIAQSDHVIDMGPGAGAKGGRIIAQGAPAQIAAADGSATGAELRKVAQPVPV